MSATGPEVAPVASVGLRPRPEVDPETLAVVTAAATLLLSGGPAPAEREEQPPAWRFSGRWWARPVPVRRDRP